MGWTSRTKVKVHTCRKPSRQVDYGAERWTELNVGDTWKCRKCKQVWSVQAAYITPPQGRGNAKPEPFLYGYELFRVED
jgi:hypothetical protein